MTSIEQVYAFVYALAAVEESCSLEPDRPFARMIHTGGERATGVHGTHDYSGSLGAAAGYRTIENPVADQSCNAGRRRGHRGVCVERRPRPSGTRRSASTPDRLPEPVKRRTRD
ncbi:hypothetical protein I553_5589 [Mycobacterium xenopi 4042]|uniref:Uncharacterized protein n=1 Tax=Mycobacterium xenopi 4042 TaxID=1299334 RepID=X7ZXA2_MYCXE|nr:hypothetical protein I553_5589 [Mycobacterium xenopi 4042]EUA52002.1 hypothetical protein I552_2949 [Mycobacterium xenopi 3993]